MGDGKKDARFPVYDKKEKCWKLETECGTEVGDALYIASEFVKTGLFYKYKVNGELTHEHSFNAVVDDLLRNNGNVSIEGFEEYFSAQELHLLFALQLKYKSRS